MLHHQMSLSMPSTMYNPNLIQNMQHQAQEGILGSKNLVQVNSVFFLIILFFFQETRGPNSWQFHKNPRPYTVLHVRKTRIFIFTPPSLSTFLQNHFKLMDDYPLQYHSDCNIHVSIPYNQAINI